MSALYFSFHALNEAYIACICAGVGRCRLPGSLRRKTRYFWIGMNASSRVVSKPSPIASNEDPENRHEEGLKNSWKRAAEPGQHVLAQQRSVIRYDVFRSVPPIHARDPALWIDDPDESRTGFEPVPDLREDFAGTIMR